MLRLQGTGRTQKIAGRCRDGTIEVVEDLTCIRKHVINQEGWDEVRAAKKLFAFVSSPKIYKQKYLLRKVQAWCHPFKHPEKRIPVKRPLILLPESDFLDSTMLHCEKERNIKYDYFYFTVNSGPGIESKGLYTFFDMLPELCRRRLRGLVIVYYPNAGLTKRFTVRVTPAHRQLLRRAEPYLTYHWGLLRDRQMDEFMKQCKFGLFPNTADNSPRIISECLSRNVPIFVNDKIHGGWHYVNDSTGSLFNMSNLPQRLKFMMSNKFPDVQSNYESKFGFKRSAKKLAKFLNPIFGYKYTHMSFAAFRKMLEKI